MPNCFGIIVLNYVSAFKSWSNFCTGDQFLVKRSTIADHKVAYLEKWHQSGLRKQDERGLLPACAQKYPRFAKFVNVFVLWSYRHH